MNRACTRYVELSYCPGWPRSDTHQIVQYDPVGVCAGIGAWNASGTFFAFKVAAALATGCTFVYKASEKSPVGVLQLGQFIKEAGFPPGVLNIVTGDGRVGAALASHMDINKVSFTGSVSAGKKVQELAAKRYAVNRARSSLKTSKNGLLTLSIQ